MEVAHRGIVRGKEGAVMEVVHRGIMRGKEGGDYGGYAQRLPRRGTVAARKRGKGTEGLRARRPQHDAVAATLVARARRGW
ncbi:putative zinc finger MIZ domain-containing protein 1 isoform [Sesbania bispinosa]|nr:putative zinc finger MIZ domain-containing protein 1 isoform [Sesbania bispinosa]